MNYAIAHAPVGSTVVLSWEKDREPKLKLLTAHDDKEAFVSTVVQLGDQVYMCMGGAEDRFALAVHIRGAKVLRIPSFKLGEVAETEHREAEDIELKKSPSGADESQEKPELKADARQQERTDRAWRIYQASWDRPDEFYETKGGDVDILVLVVRWKAFHLMQRTRMAAHLRLLAVYRDMYLVDAALMSKAMTAEAMTEEEYILERVKVDPVFADVPVEARKKYLEELVTGNILFEGVEGVEKEISKGIERLMRRLPVFTQVFEPIAGCGSLTAARVIGTISDIRRFEDDAKLKAYAGYHHFKDGSRARRVKGQMSNWNQVLKQGVWQFCQRQVKSPQGSSEWRDWLDRRRAYELTKLLATSGVEYKYIPSSMRSFMPVRSTRDLSVDDLEIILAFVDGLRGETELTVTSSGPDEEGGKAKKVKMTYLEALEVKYEGKLILKRRVKAAYEEALAVSSEETITAMKGIKGRALNKACRWLGQRFLRHIFISWSAYQLQKDESDKAKAAAQEAIGGGSTTGASDQSSLEVAVM